MKAIFGDSLRATLVRRLAVALAALGVIAAVISYALAARYVNLAYDRALFDNVAVLADEVEEAGGALSVDLPPQARKWLLADEGEKVVYRVTDLVSGFVAVSNIDLGPVPQDARIIGRPYYRDVDVGQTVFRVAYTRWELSPHGGVVLVEVGETISKRSRMARSILAGVIVMMLAIVIVACVMVWRGVSVSLAPLGVLESQAAQRSGTNLTPLDPALAPTEVRGLIEAINRMMLRVSAAMDAQHRFTANAAHQLRTPIASVRLLAQISLKAATLDEARTGIVQVEASAVQATHVIEQLLTLAQAQSEGGSGQMVPVRLDNVAREVVERFLGRADRRGIDLGFAHSADGIVVNGNAVLLVELTANLVDNAITYGHSGGRVTIEVAAQPDGIELAVVDDGPGFSEGEHMPGFHRFHRPDSSPGGGAGLGLAIVREIALMHGASLDIGSIVGEGSRVVVHFPTHTSQRSLTRDPSTH